MTMTPPLVADRPPRVTALPIQIEIRDGVECVFELRDTWRDLFDRAGQEPSTSYEWTAAMCGHHVRAADQIRLVVLRQADRVIGLIPLILRTVQRIGQPIRLLTLLTEENNTHSDVLVVERSDAVADAVADALHQLDLRWDCFRMSRSLDDNPLQSLMLGAFARRGTRHGRRAGAPSYFLPLPTTFEAYLAARSSKFRNYLKRVAKKSGTFVVTVLDDPRDASRFDEAFDGLLAVERESWKEQHGTSITAVRRQLGFYRDMSRGALNGGRLHLQLLSIDGRYVAYNLGYVRGAEYWYLKTSFHRDFGAISPATVLRAQLIEDLIERGVRRFDFPGEPYEWERQWTTDVRWHSVITAYSGTIRSHALELLERVRHRNRERTLEHVNPRMLRPPSSRDERTPDQVDA